MPIRHKTIQISAGLTALILILVLAGTPAHAITWDGGGSTENASEADNWTPNEVPTSASDIVLDGVNDKNMTWDAGVSGLPNTVASWDQQSGYSGTVTILTKYSDSFTNFIISDNCTINGGTWNHYGNSGGTPAQYLLRVEVVSNMTIGADAEINVVGLGYTYCAGPGAGVANTRAVHV